MAAPRRPFVLIAHRGDSDGAPENTLAAFDRALSAGFAAFETDAQLTADGVPVLLHCEALGRTTDGVGAVADKTLQEIKALDAGSWFSPEHAGGWRGSWWSPPKLRPAFGAPPLAPVAKPQPPVHAALPPVNNGIKIPCLLFFSCFTAFAGLPERTGGRHGSSGTPRAQRSHPSCRCGSARARAARQLPHHQERSPPSRLTPQASASQH
jgi:hypothetical protein